mgnify:CR=1 FL=1
MNYVSDSVGTTIPSDLSGNYDFGTLGLESLSLILSVTTIRKKIESLLRLMQLSLPLVLRFHPHTEDARKTTFAK